MIAFRVLDAIDALGIVPRLCARHREEIQRTHADLQAWARGRVVLPGPQWALEVDLQVVAIGGVIDEGDTGTLWFAGAMGWERHVRPMLRAFREIRLHGAFRHLRCRCYADNFAAQHMAEKLGFARGEPRDGIVNYGMTL